MANVSLYRSRLRYYRDKEIEVAKAKAYESNTPYRLGELEPIPEWDDEHRPKRLIIEDKMIKGVKCPFVRLEGWS